MRRVLLLVWLVVASLLFRGAAFASDDAIDIERTLSEILQDKRLKEAKGRGDVSKRDVSEEEAAEQAAEEANETETEGKRKGSRAIVPEVGFSPEKGANGGIKFTDRDIRGLTFDVSASAAQKGQYKVRGSIVAPDLFAGWGILYLGGLYKMDPTMEFFGLGNNEVGPDELSTHEWQRMNGRIAFALRPTSRLLVVASGEYNEIEIQRGDRKKDTPVTEDAFPRLVGVHGGKTSPLSIAVIFDDRDDVTRPIKGWNVIAKYQRIDRALGNRFEFNRYTFQASYLYPLLTRRQVIGMRAGGEYIDSRPRGTPFFEYSSLGGADDMRGYFQDRFLGKAKVIVGAEYRLKLFDFDFFDIWNVKVDGVGFGDAARVFLDRDELEDAFEEDESTLPDTNDEFRFSYGGGLRFALGEAIVARLDVGFSDEEHGLVYLVFGHTF